MKNYFLYSIFLLIIFSCSKSKDEVIFEYNFENQENRTQQNKDFSKSFNNDTLVIKVVLDECGEWGGPEEKIKIFKNKNNEIFLEYSKSKFNCDSIGEYYSYKPILDYKKTIPLNEKFQNKVAQYITKLSNAKLYEYVYSNAGSIYEISKTDSTMYINIHTENRQIEELYSNLKTELNLKK